MKKNSLKIKVGKVFRQSARAKNKVVVNVGGARSGKSYAMAQLLIMRALNQAGSQIGVTRKTMPALKMTSRRLILELLSKYGLYQSARWNKTENYYLLPNLSRFQFFSLDDAEKIKSSEFNYLWLEEANEFTYQDYLVLLTRLSARSQYQNQMFLTLNPTDANCWIAKHLKPRADVLFINSTYRDNPFLSQSYIDTLLSLKDYDENAYKVFALGQWGCSQRLIYPSWRLASAPQSCEEVIWGLDFGFNNPSALVKIYIKDAQFFCEEVLYQTSLTTKALCARLEEIIPHKDRAQTIYADSAEPDRIAEISSLGFNIKPAQKNILCGILAVRSVGLNITPSSVNLIKEAQTYSWKTDNAGAVLETPVKFQDHALDALRYAIYTYKTEAPQAEPSVSFF